MDQTGSIIVGVIISLVLLVMVVPKIIAQNKGRVLQNSALWLAIFLVLGVLYKVLGPDVTQMPVQQMRQKAMESASDNRVGNTQTSSPAVPEATVSSPEDGGTRTITLPPSSTP